MQLDLGTKIRQLRRRDGRTQENLAEALGVTSQAVSRWESCGSYPDMNLLPSIANYFGVTIDTLFGYNSDRTQKIDSLVSRIQDLMPWANQAMDSTADKCIALAREALIEFPGNEKLMLCLASALYQAGYVRYGEHHLTDNEGYGIYDTTRHRTYGEWREAIPIYEKVLATLPAGDLRNKAVSELSQLYLNTGDYGRSLALAESAPDLFGSKEILLLNACDGRKQAQAYSKAILCLIHTCAELMVRSVIQNGENLTSGEKVQCIQNAIGLFANICTDGNYCDQNPFIGKMYLLLSVYLWLDHQQEQAFEALDSALAHCKMFEEICDNPSAAYTAPLVRHAAADVQEMLKNNPFDPHTLSARLPEDWPWWHVPEESQVRSEMQADPRWDLWITKTQA